jgi:hypothetical protein
MAASWILAPGCGAARTTSSESVSGEVDSLVESGLTFDPAPETDEDVAPSFGTAPLRTVAQAEPLIPPLQGSEGESVGCIATGAESRGVSAAESEAEVPSSFGAAPAASALGVKSAEPVFQLGADASVA